MPTATITPARVSYLPALLLCFGLMLVPISASGAGITISPIAADLEAGPAAASWIVTGFMVSFGALMGVAGSLADLFGRRRLLRGGFALFALAQIAGALAPNMTLELVCRVVSGAAAAAVVTAGSALLAEIYTGPERQKIFGLLGTALGIGLSFGPLLAGIVIDVFGGWRVQSALLGVLALVLLVGTLALPDSRPGQPPAFDRWGAAGLIVTLTTFVLGVTFGGIEGWDLPWVWGLLALSVAAMVAFVLWQLRAPAPLVDVRLVLQRRFLAVALAPTISSLAFVTTVLTLPNFFAAVDGTSALDSGLILLLATVPTLLVPFLGVRLVDRIGLRWLLTASCVLLGIGAAWLTVLRPGIGIISLAPPLILIGCGFGLALAVVDGAAISSVPPEQAGMAAGVFNTFRLGSETIAVAVAASILASVVTSRVSDESLADRVLAGQYVSDSAAADALTAGWQLFLIVAAVVCFLGAATIYYLLAPRDSEQS